MINYSNFNNFVIFGKGGQGSVVKELAILNNLQPIKIIDDSSGADEKKLSKNDSIIIAIGDNKIRKSKSLIYKENINRYLIHPNSYVSETSVIGNGSVIFANTILNTCSNIGENVIVNSSVVIEHHCFIENYVHLAPSVTLCGNVKIEEGAFIGAGTTILPGVVIGKWSIVGAGSVVLKNVSSYETVFGNPAKKQ